MSTVQLKALTPIHIGSGSFLQQGSDFIVNNESDGTYLYVIDDNKVFNLIGEDNIGKWVQCIERQQDTADFIRTIRKGVKPVSFSKRNIYSFESKIPKGMTLKETLHDGLGTPYIPGSSIKGAIRTAILAEMAKSVPDLSELFNHMEARAIDSKMEKQIFGDSPYTDILRFLQVGDAYFNKDCEIALMMANLNIRTRNSIWDNSKKQLIEAIGTDESTKLNINIDKKRAELSNCGFAFHKIDSIQKLFRVINNHTKKLLKEECKIWNNQLETINSNMSYNAEDEEYISDYIQKIEGLNKQITESENPTNCILRIGHASGWRFITGAWGEKLSCFENVIIPASRPNNQRYSEYIFPKTRRVSTCMDLLGFVEISIS